MSYLSRRRLLQVFSCTVFNAVITVRAQAKTANIEQLVAQPADILLDKEVGAKTPLWSFNNTSPGPLIRVPQNGRVDLELLNKLPEATAVHWHGIRIDNNMDGAVGLTQEPVPPGESFRYAFDVPDAGTYWYHAHLRSFEQVARGLYGILIVDESEPPVVDQDLLFVVDDWRLNDAGKIVNNFGNLHDISHGGRIGNWLTVNGRGFETYQVRKGEMIRLRMVNVSNALVMRLRLKGAEAAVAAVDGMPVVPFELQEDKLDLSPGQRVDLFARMTGEPDAGIDFVDRQGTIRLARFEHQGTALKAITDFPNALASNPVTLPNAVNTATKVKLEMQGGAMGRMHSAKYQDKELPIRELVKHGMAWSLNGQAGMSDTPLFRAKRGEQIELSILNDTQWPHAMHTHGHHFVTKNKLNVNATPTLLRDTALVDPGETLPVRFVADNPGKWLVHCHMLEHQAGGMVTWFEVE